MHAVNQFNAFKAPGHLNKKFPIATITATTYIF